MQQQNADPRNPQSFIADVSQSISMLNPLNETDVSGLGPSFFEEALDYKNVGRKADAGLRRSARKDKRVPNYIANVSMGDEEFKE
jgi:hypothetical protein